MSFHADPVFASRRMALKDGYFYLFASYDYCCKGINSTYYTCMGRSKTITGPYLDQKGKSMMEGYGSVILKADQEEKDRWRDPGQDYIFYHAYDKYPPNKDPKMLGAPYLRIAPLVWSADGWPAALM